MAAAIEAGIFSVAVPRLEHSCQARKEARCNESADGTRIVDAGG